jgi:hypothetical protein
VLCEKDFKYKLDMLILHAGDSRLRNLGVSDIFVKRIRKYISLLYQDDARYLSKLALTKKENGSNHHSRKISEMGASHVSGFDHVDSLSPNIEMARRQSMNSDI